MGFTSKQASVDRTSARATCRQGAEPWCSGSVGEGAPLPILKNVCLKYLLSVYLVPDIVIMTNRKIKQYSALSPQLIKPSFSRPVTWAFFLVVIILIGEGGLVTGRGLCWVSPCWGFLGGFALFEWTERSVNSHSCIWVAALFWGGQDSVLIWGWVGFKMSLKKNSFFLIISE